MSKNNFFSQSKVELDFQRDNLVKLLRIKLFKEYQIEYCLSAFDFFTTHPEDYDGATMSQDLHDLPRTKGFSGLEVSSMVHDYMHIALNAYADEKAIKKSDQVFKTIMRKMDKSGVEIKWRMLRLSILSIFYPWYNRVFRGYSISKEQTEKIDNIYNDFK